MRFGVFFGTLLQFRSGLMMQQTIKETVPAASRVGKGLREFFVVLIIAKRRMFRFFDIFYGFRDFYLTLVLINISDMTVSHAFIFILSNCSSRYQTQVPSSSDRSTSGISRHSRTLPAHLSFRNRSPKRRFRLDSKRCSSLELGRLMDHLGDFKFD